MNYSTDKPKKLFGKEYSYDSFFNNEILLDKKNESNTNDDSDEEKILELEL